MKVFLVAGEASADVHGAALLKELKSLDPELKCFGVGGPLLSDAGMDIRVPAEQLSILGITGWWDKAGGAWKAYRSVVRSLKTERPDVGILLDLPDFNLMVAGHLKRLGIPVIYYISPQVWAWRRYRVSKIRRRVNKMLVVFPFEKEFYDEHQVPCEFVGHPLLDRIVRRVDFRSQQEIFQSPRIAMLPGSRTNEILHHSPIIRELARLLKARYPGAQFRVPVAKTLPKELVANALGDTPCEFYEGDSQDVIRWADLAVVASGTATLETALVETPFCLFYKVSSFNAWLLKAVARYRGLIGMPNLLLKEEVGKEFFQQKADPSIISEECIQLIENENYRQRVISRLAECRGLLGTSGASRKAALAVFQLFNVNQPVERSSFVPTPSLA